MVDRDSHKVLYSMPFTTRLNADAPTSVTPSELSMANDNA
jgi:hypothetical protein